MVSDDVEAKTGDDETEQNSRITCTFQMTNYGNDVNDRPSDNGSVTKTDIASTICSIFTHFLHVGFGLSLCARYFIVRQLAHFYWTMAFIFIPSMVNIVISLRMYNQDIERCPDPGNYRRKSFASKAIRNKIWFIFIVIFQLAPVLRLIDSLIYGIKSRKCKKQGDPVNQQRYYLKMLKEDEDIALLRVFECYLEAAPLQILQITIIFRNYHQTFDWELIHQCCSIISSLASMGWAMASYNRIVRLAQWDKLNIELVGMILQFFWHFLITVSRIITISVVASICYIYTGTFCIVHWLAMTTWIVLDDSGTKEFCRNRKRPPHTPLKLNERICSVMFASVIGLVYIFIYIHHTHGPMLFRHSLYYSICLAENAVVCYLWARGTSNENLTWYLKFFIPFCILPYIFGVIAMILYYMFSHPTKKNTRCPIQEDNNSNNS